MAKVLAYRIVLELTSRVRPYGLTARDPTNPALGPYSPRTVCTGLTAPIVIIILRDAPFVRRGSFNFLYKYTDFIVIVTILF
jgi:hypothetical protein